MGKQLFIAAFHNIQVSASLGPGERLGNEIRLTNDPKVISKKISQRMVEHFGAIEMEHLLSSGLVAYLDADVRPTTRGDNGKEALDKFMAQLKLFQLALWVRGDNAVSFENAFLEWDQGEGTVVTSNHWDGRCSSADGTMTGLELGREELRQARATYVSMSPGEQGLQELLARSVLNPGEPLAPDLPRWSRFLFFIQGARRPIASSLKVAEYCSAFEAVLSTSANELSYRLSERLAWLLARDAEGRLQVFRKAKAAYDVRSKAVHGSSVKKSKLDTTVVEASRNCDAMARSLIGAVAAREDLRKGFWVSEFTNEQLEDVLLRTTLGMNSDFDK